MAEGSRRTIEDEDMELEDLAQGWSLEAAADPRVDREMASLLAGMDSIGTRRDNITSAARPFAPPSDISPKEQLWQPWAQKSPPRATHSSHKRDWAAVQAAEGPEAPGFKSRTLSSGYTPDLVAKWIHCHFGKGSPASTPMVETPHDVEASRWRTGEGYTHNDPSEPIRRDPEPFYCAPGEPGDPNTHTPGLGFIHEPGDPTRQYHTARSEPWEELPPRQVTPPPQSSPERPNAPPAERSHRRRHKKSRRHNPY